MNDLDIGIEHRNARLEGTRAFLDAGPAAACLQIFGNDRPAFGQDAGTAPLAVLVLAKPSGVTIDGVLTLAAPDEALILVEGVARWARLLTGAGVIAADCNVSLSTGTAPVRLSRLELHRGGTTRLLLGVLR